MTKRKSKAAKAPAPPAVPRTTSPAAAAPRTFALYPEERHWWSFNDYGAVVDVVRALGARRVLEFGPGSSTLALIEGGATHIDTLEDDPHWAEVYETRLAPRFPAIVHLHRYRLTDAAAPAAITGAYDLALIDGPLDRQARVGVLMHCLDSWQVRAVLIPIDASDEMTERLEAIKARPDLAVTVRETGPLAGAFALIVRTTP